MKSVFIAGAGKIGVLIAAMLSESNDYQIYLADIKLDSPDIQRLFIQERSNIELLEFDVSDKAAVDAFFSQKKIDAVISSLPYTMNAHVARLASDYQLHYFDLTEDVSVTELVKELSINSKSAFVPQCGLAPGFIGITANSLMNRFDEVDTVKMRVGALPQHTSNALHYALTWSTEGLINEYGNDCFGIKNGEKVIMHPLQGLEHIQIDGLSYEAFNTSGGLGALADLCKGKVRNLDYKTMRYPGHCEKMKVLMTDLKLNEDRETLKRILENAIPKTYQDVVVVYVSVTGMRRGAYLEENYINKIYPREIASQTWSAIQVTTASGICAVADMVLSNPDQYQGFVHQEQFALETFLENRFADCYR